MFKQNTRNSAVVLSSVIQFSKFNVFFGLFLNSTLIFHIQAHKDREQPWGSRCWIAIWGMKTKDLTARNHKSRTLKMPATIETLPFDIMRKNLSGCYNQQNFKPHLKIWTLWNFAFVFCLPICWEESHLGSVQWLSPQCCRNWKLLQIFKK